MGKGDKRVSYYTTRLKGRIVDGAIETDTAETLRLRTSGEVELAQARLRFEVLPDGNLKGVIGGYRDWREIAGGAYHSSAEFYHGFQQPGLFNSLKRNADGMRNPITGEYDGISTAYDIEGVPAFAVRPSTQLREFRR